MADKKKGLKRPQPPVDIFTLRPEPDLLPSEEEEEKESADGIDEKTTEKTDKARVVDTEGDEEEAIETPNKITEIAINAQPETEKTTRRSQRKKKSTPQRKDPPEKKIKTSVELSPETIELIKQIQTQHRREHNELLPTWQILDSALKEIASLWLKE